LPKIKDVNADETYMRQCLDLASRSLGKAAPNPMVGCVIVNEDKVIGEGFHESFGGPHAEVNAISAVSDSSLLTSSTLYVNLEPCVHYGKTPPCVDLIIENKIPHIVVGCIDSYEQVAGTGVHRLSESGCEVTIKILENECRELNKRFLTFHEKKRPYIILKWAQSKDGFFTAEEGEQTWITNDESKKLVHKWRTEECAILVGTKTVEIDNPQLTAREWEGSNPMRVILDREARLPESLNVFDGSVPTLVFTESKEAQQTNVKFIPISFDDLIPSILEQLYEREIQSVIVEGGKKLLSAFIDAGAWDEARIFTGHASFSKGITAPTILGNLTMEEDVSGDQLSVYSSA